MTFFALFILSLIRYCLVDTCLAGLVGRLLGMRVVAPPPFIDTKSRVRNDGCISLC